MKQTVEEAAKECRRTTAQSMGVYAQYHSIDAVSYTHLRAHET